MINLDNILCDVKDKFNQCAVLAALVNTRNFNLAMYDEVARSFYAFTPLRSSPVEVASLPLGFRICAGKTLLIYRRDRSRGKNISEPNDIFDVLRYCGEKVAENVSGKKGEHLAEFVELVRKLKVYENIVWTYQLNPPFKNLLGDPSLEADMVKVESDSSPVLYFMREKKKVYELHFGFCQEVLELLEPLTVFYESVAEKIFVTCQHNRMVLEKIGELVAPWKAAKALKSF